MNYLHLLLNLLGISLSLLILLGISLSLLIIYWIYAEWSNYRIIQKDWELRGKHDSKTGGR